MTHAENSPHFWLQHLNEYVSFISSTLEPLTRDLSFTGMCLDVSLDEGSVHPCRTLEVRFKQQADAMAFGQRYEKIAVLLSRHILQTHEMQIMIKHRQDRFVTCIQFKPKKKKEPTDG